MMLLAFCPLVDYQKPYISVLWMQLEHERFKLDAAAIRVSPIQQHSVIVYNFNLPIGLTQDPTNWDIIKNIVETDLPLGVPGTVNPPYFQITAVYTLVHQNTYETRYWLGSYSPRARNLSQVTTFRPYDPATFINYCILNSELERVRNKLTAVVNGRQSLWTLDHIISVIVSVQATVQQQHSIFTERPALAHQANHRRRNVFRIYFD
jgi:hypothetical protein